MKTSKPIPPVIRSREHLAAQGVSFVPPGNVEPSALPITADGVTYIMAQEATWIDTQHFAVGRWDGSLSIFSFNASPTTGPIITKAVNTPALEGVQMITWLAPGAFASSNDESSIIVWSSPSGTWTDLYARATLQYDSSLGVANSGDAVVLGNILYLGIGHANGFVSIWSGNTDGTGLQFVTALDLRNPHPTNPWGLHNIRGISTIFWNDSTGYIVTGSEDGYICVLRLPDGAIMSQTVYNPGAQRGINSVATFGQNLLIANCAVGSADKNLWYYWIDGNDFSVTLKDSTNLRVNPSAPQVFNFCAIWGLFNNQVGFFSSTEEGALWAGTVNPNQTLSVIGYQTVFGALGSALAFNVNGNLVVINYNLFEFTTTQSQLAAADQHPERLSLALLPSRLAASGGRK
jgi:WD40 repeat protein